MASTILHTIITPSAVIPTNFIQQNKPGTRTPVNFLKFMIFHTESICLTLVTTEFFTIHFLVWWVFFIYWIAVYIVYYIRPVHFIFI